MTSHRLRVFLVGCLAAVAWPAMAQLVPISKVLGVWEVTDVVRRRGAEPSDVAVQGYADMIGTQVTVHRDGLEASIVSFNGGHPSGSGALKLYKPRAWPLRHFFRDNKGERDSSIWDGLMAEYSLRDVLGREMDRPFTEYYFKIQRMTTVYPYNSRFVTTGSVLLMDTDGDSILVLRRPPKTRDAAHAAYCRQLSETAIAYEKQICASRETWLRYRFVEASKPCALTQPQVLSERSLEFLAARDMQPVLQCKGDDAACVLKAVQARLKTYRERQSECSEKDRYCAFELLHADALLLGALMPPTKACVDGKYVEAVK